MTYKNILILADGTPASEAVIRFICGNQKEGEVVIHIVYVAEVPRSLPLSECPENILSTARTAIANAQKIADELQTPVLTQIIYARATEDAVLKTAEDLKCDLIALAQNNQKLRLIANVAQGIYQRAKCSVCLMNVK